MVQTQGRSGTTVSTVNASTCGAIGGVDSTATGVCSEASQNGASAYGSNAYATSENATAIGFRSTASQSGAVAIGYGATASGDPTTAVGAMATASGNNSVALGAGALASGQNSVALGAGSQATVDNTVSVGSAGNERRITNVAAGTNWTDAVNVGQLNQWGYQTNARIDNLSKMAYSGIAMSAALAGLPQVDPGKHFMVGAGVGGYEGYSALSVGASARFNDNVIIKAGVSKVSGTSHILFNAGAGVEW